ncbi:hypothetical protein G3567_02940 [Psychroflexus sp. YR1-1]|uniref:Uncharacterized protein n=1 Tax=Psychroflexus aurantiacus TaxID=2709310 RepID=A0A6B3R6J8_9FLAO|nr:hypothetical protein [Psychroflexus aurantiacus]NEV93104.1 hypothetical protein [Psychroflexus aurantiacus]
MLNSIQTYFIKKRLNSSKGSESLDFSESKVGLLYNEDVSDKDQLLERMAKNFDVDSSEIHVLGFSRKAYAKEKQPDFVFLKKDFSLLGQIQSEVIAEFLATHYKLLFNFFGKDEIYLERIAQLTQAKLKLGFSESNQNVNDLLLDLDPKDLSFFEEGSKYIKHII